jgi:predicted PurR-regulated permease PerM
MKLFTDLVKRYGIGIVLGAATLDGYRRQLMNERANNILEVIQKERNSLSEERQKVYDTVIENVSKETRNKAVIGRYKEVADELQKSIDKYEENPTDYNKNEKNRLIKKLDDSYNEIQKLDISEIFISLYNKYIEYLLSLSSDKIVCLFNIIIDGLLLSSFISVLSLMLSENIINKISFLDKYPRILNLLKLRNNINKQISKFYLFMHLTIIVIGIISNIFMFFI